MMSGPRYWKNLPVDVADVAAVADQIRSDVTLLGVAGTYVPGDPLVNRPRSRYNAGNLIARASFDATAKLTNTSGVTVSLDSANTLHTADTPGVSLKLTKGTSASDFSVRHVLGSHVSAAHGVMVLWFYLHPGTGIAAPEKLDYVQVELYDHTHGYSNYVTKFKLWLDSKLVTTDANGVGGWYCVPVSLDCPSSLGSSGAAIRPEIDTIRIILNANAAADVPIVTLDALEFYNTPFAAAWYSVRIDGDTTAAYDMAVSLTALSVDATFGIAPANIGTSGHMTVANLVEIQGWGHQLALYAGDQAERAAWQAKTEADKRTLLADAAAWCLANSLPLSLARTVFASGGTGFIPHDRLLLQEAQCKQFGGLDGTYAISAGELETAFRPEVMHTGYFIAAATGGTTPTAVTALIALAATAKLGISLGSHVATANERATLLACVADLQTATIADKTWAEVLEGNL